MIEKIALEVSEIIWKRFLYKPFGILLDYTDLDGNISIPTPEECKNGFINKLGWWTPIENGAFFNGLYLSSLCNLYVKSKKTCYAEKAKIIAKGLMLLSNVSNTKGFIARGVSTDGISHYPIGSDDQTGPWFHGLWRYINTDIPTMQEKHCITNKMIEVAEAILKNEWRLPCENTKETRGNFKEPNYRCAARLVFICKIMGVLTQEKKWDKLYSEYLFQKTDKNVLSRLEMFEKGIKHDFLRCPELAYELWIYLDAQNCMRELISLEVNSEIKEKFIIGLTENAKTVLCLITRYLDYDNESDLKFDVDWRKLGTNFYKSDSSVMESVQLASRQLKYWEFQILPKKRYENRFVREPLSACYILASSLNENIVGESSKLIESCLLHYNYNRIYSSLVFLVEGIYSVI